ncbi:MAG: metal-dependent hydrolase [Bacteroidota bacterium]
MDSITQAVLGSTAGVASGGPRLGRRAAAWGAVGGTLPDLDIVAYPFLDSAGQLLFHRGITHGVLFPFLAAPLIGWLVWRFYWWRGRTEDTWRAWTGVFFWAFATHAPLDALTVYGTQLLAPFSPHPFAVSSVFIIDPVVTLAMAVGLVVSIRAGASPRARRASLIGLGVAGIYLGAGVAMQAQARATVEAALVQRGIEAERLLVAAGPLSSFHWRGVALEDGQIHPFWLHVTDGPEAVTIEPSIPLAVLPPDLAASRTGSTLLWFSRGWLTEVPADSSRLGTEAEEGEPTLTVADVRFGRLGLDPTDPWVFAWRVDREPPFAFEQIPQVPSFGEGELARLLRRIVGADPPAAAAVPSRTPPPDSPSP